ncbi:MAG: metal-dependent hydrolase [Chitinophagales bacterium]|jgi:L-ascorbate metabolism protein UlaG (beta-lactamase superfamily)|nr:metal-dependent hydrolase [Chitinophagales bacterium]
MKITYLGHSSLYLETQGIVLLLDPFISANPQAQAINIEDLSPDFILVTHAHLDHVLDVVHIAKKSSATIVANHEISEYYQKQDLTTIGLNHGGTVNLKGVQVKMTSAVHTSSFADGTYGGNPSGFVVSSGDTCVYIAGDTALTYDMKLIQDTFQVDLAVLPIGGHYTMDYIDACKASDFVGATRVLGVHYDTFPPISIDSAKARAYFAQNKKELILLNIGQHISI